MRLNLVDVDGHGKIFQTLAIFGARESNEVCFIFTYRIGSAYMDHGKYASILNMSTFLNILQGSNLNDSKSNSKPKLFDGIEGVNYYKGNVPRLQNCYHPQAQNWSVGSLTKTANAFHMNSFLLVVIFRWFSRWLLV